jgi:hypothetical protein
MLSGAAGANVYQCDYASRQPNRLPSNPLTLSAPGARWLRIACIGSASIVCAVCQAKTSIDASERSPPSIAISRAPVGLEADGRLTMLITPSSGDVLLAESVAGGTIALVWVDARM